MSKTIILQIVRFFIILKRQHQSTNFPPRMNTATFNLFNLYTYNTFAYTSTYVHTAHIHFYRVITQQICCLNILEVMYTSTSTYTPHTNSQRCTHYTKRICYILNSLNFLIICPKVWSLTPFFVKVTPAYCRCVCRNINISCQCMHMSKQKNIILSLNNCFLLIRDINK